jgi:hypothetical protein
MWRGIWFGPAVAMFYSHRIGIATDVPKLAKRPSCFVGSSRKCTKRRRFWPQSKTTIGTMKTLAVICILALLTITGAAYSDQLLTSEQVTAQRTN